jgi:ribonuclease HII
MKKDSIMLTPTQRQSLEQVISQGKNLAWTIKHAQVLLHP